MNGNIFFLKLIEKKRKVNVKERRNLNEKHFCGVVNADTGAAVKHC